MNKSTMKKTKLSSNEKIIICFALICLFVLLCYKIIASVPKEQQVITYTVYPGNQTASADAGQLQAQVSSQVMASDLLNINTATLAQLTNLPSIGEEKAAAIIEYRNTNGNFETIEELKNVHGIGDKIFEKIKDFITVD